ncbi:MAG: ribulose bisphosphate carboxylase small subunit [Thioalkalispiraceae bacterium]
MQPVSQHSSLADLPCLSEIEDLITENLLHDWAVRIEHTNKLEPHQSSWQQWGNTMFALKEPSQAMLGIRACRTGYPAHAIRIHAEKFKPRVSFIYWVYRHDTGTEQKPIHNQAIKQVTNRNWLGWLPDVINSAQSARTRAWRFASLMGILLASIFVLEQAIA